MGSIFGLQPFLRSPILKTNYDRVDLPISVTAGISSVVQAFMFSSLVDRLASLLINSCRKRDGDDVTSRVSAGSNCAFHIASTSLIFIGFVLRLFPD